MASTHSMTSSISSKLTPHFEGILVEHYFKECVFRASGLLIERSTFVTSGSVLAPLVLHNMIDNYPDSLYSVLETHAVLETCCSEMKTNLYVQKNISEHCDIRKCTDKTLRCRAKLKYIKNCTELSEIFCTHLSDWATIRDYKKEKYKDCVDRKYPPIYTTFLFFELDTKEVPHMLNFFQCIDKLQQCCQSSFKKGDRVCLETTPFGSISFINSYSEGIISAVVEPTNCLFLTDASAAPGSEGGPVFKITKSMQRVPVGMVLSSISFWKDEWVGFTLCVTLVTILNELKRHSEKHSIDYAPILNHADESIVKVCCGPGWGSGILINNEHGLIITSSHVVKYNSRIKCFWRRKSFDVELLYRTRNEHQYDIAILKAKPTSVNGIKAIKFMEKYPQKGDPVIALGFAFFEDMTHPLVTRGSVAQCSDCMIQTTCCIQPGASGGAIVNLSGELIGIIVCNTTSDDSQMSFPHINMSIPSHIIKTVITRYLASKDISVLNELQINTSEVTRKWNLVSSKL